MKNLKELRIERNLSQADLAKVIGTSQKNISRWENGENDPSAYFVIKVADFFQVTTDYLLGLNDHFELSKMQEEKVAVTPEERKILNAYRELTPSNKELILRMLKID